MTKNLYLKNGNQQRQSLKIFIPAFPYHNVFSDVAKRTTSLGPIMVATAANKAFPLLDVEVIDENNYRGPRTQGGLPDHAYLQKQRPADIVGFYCGLTSTMPRVYELAKFYKSQGAITIAGGDHVCQLPEEALNNSIDIVVRGEGELAIVEIIKAINSGTSLEKVDGISWQKDGRFFHNQPEKLVIGDLNSLPRPDFGLLRWAKKLTFFPVLRIKGCSRRCEFCTIDSEPRWSNARHMFQDILWLVQTNKKAKYFFIVDDNLGEDPIGTKEFFELIIKAKAQGDLPKKIKFIVQIRLDAAVYQLELLKLMSQAGVFVVCIGYESPIEAELRAMRKGIKPSDMVEYTKVFKKLGFLIHGMFIFGYPGDKQIIQISARQREQEFKKFIRLAKPATIQVLAATPVPGAKLFARLDRQGRIYPREILGWEFYDGHVVSEPDPPMKAEEAQQSIVEIMRWFYSGWNFWRVPLLILSFPIIVPFSSFSYWYRLFRNTLRGFMGYRIIVKWKKMHKQSNFLQRLTMARRRLYNK